ncbi:MAG: NAD(P)/FAD-dependent oxidoreductase [Oscillospiraceae bacterium]|nr:NAD(P)/FAD-dependent oxidoreductase [Oscillospiraceae bacterium]
MKIVVIGAGASGMMAAIAAAENPTNEVYLLERQARVGRKLLATGNGRCNLSNAAASLAHYHGEAPDFVQPALAAFGAEQTIAFFQKLGLLTVCEASGKYYPYSDQAASVLDVLRFALEKSNLHLRCGCEVQSVKKEKVGFNVRTKEEHFLCDRVIVACGGIAGSKLGGGMSGYQVLRSLGHQCTKLRPALVQLRSSYPRCPSLKGIRANCYAEILKDYTIFAASQGEIQFTEYGASGPVIFEISRDVCSTPGCWQCRLDLLPQLAAGELALLLSQRQRMFPQLLTENLLTGVLQNRLGRVIAQEAGLSLQRPIKELTQANLEAAAQTIKQFVLTLTEPMGMDSAQVTAGGIRTAEFTPETMESRFVPGLYACGEVLDIDGDCGGFNLQWAWSSGHLAGLCAGRNL